MKSPPKGRQKGLAEGPMERSGEGQTEKDDMDRKSRFSDKRSSRFGSVRRSSGMRRLLAMTCALCMVALQCFVVLPAVTGSSYADGGLDISCDYNGSTYDKNYKDGIDSTVGGLLDKVGVNSSKVSSIESDIGSLNKSDKIKKEGGEYCIVTIETHTEIDPETGEETEVEEEVYTPISYIFFKMDSGYSPIKSISVASLENAKKGSTYSVKYKVEGDSFFKGDNNYEEFLDASATNASIEDIDYKNTKVKYYVTGSTGSKVKITVKDKISGKSDSSSTKIVTKSITVKPSSLYLQEDQAQQLTAYDDSGNKISASSLKWSSKSSKIAKVSKKGNVRGKKAGSTTITVKDPSSGLTASVSVTVRAKITTRTYTTYRPTGRTGVTVTRPGGATGTSGIPTTATRPPIDQSSSIDTPSFQTIAVKEVYLTPATQDSGGTYYDEYGNPVDDAWDDEDYEDGEDYDEDGVGVPAAAGSAAVALAACGVGAVGRVRRFRHDMGDIKAAAAAAGTVAAGKGKRKFLRKGQDADAADVDNTAQNNAPDTEAMNAGTEAENDGKGSKNPLKKFRKKH